MKPPPRQRESTGSQTLFSENIGEIQGLPVPLRGIYGGCATAWVCADMLLNMKSKKK